MRKDYCQIQPITTRPRATGATISKVMTFKIDKNLERVASAKGAEPSIVAVELCDRVVKSGIIEDPAEHWGETVFAATGPRYVSDVCKVLAGYLYEDEKHTVPSETFWAFAALILIGDGDCPHCGGELKFVETEGHELKDGDYFTPNSYVIDRYVYRCKYCGETIKTIDEL